MRRRLAALVAALTGATVLAALPGGPSPASASPTAAPAAPAAAFAPQPIRWGRCSDPYLRDAKAKCGDLVVPLDHAQPDGATITLKVSRILHTTKKSHGVMLTNPGGPGGSGTWMATYGAMVPDGVGKRFDWYGFDPRGVGESKPALTCDGGYTDWARPPYVPTTAKIEKAWKRKAAGYARDCGSAKAKRLLDHVRTTDTVADLEILRQAIGAETVGFYGASYGTYLAQVYATLHPDRLDRMVLDGVIDADTVFYRSNLDQDLAFEKALRKFFAWIGKNHDEYRLGRSGKAVRTSYEQLLRRLAKRPAAGKIGPAELTDVLTTAGYTVNAWSYLAATLSDLRNNGDARAAISLYGGPGKKGADNGYAMYLATECTDAPWPDSWQKWERDNRRLHRKAPFLTWSNAWYNAPCRTWPAASGPRVDVSSAGIDFPVLLLSETLDAATPYAGALATRALFPTSALVAGKGGTTHAAGLSGIACVDDTIARYLKNGTLPKRQDGRRADRTCAAVQPPSAQGPDSRIGLGRVQEVERRLPALARFSRP